MELGDERIRTGGRWSGLAFGLLALCAGGLVGALAVNLSPVKLIMLFVACLAAWAIFLSADLGLIGLVLITYTRFSDVMIWFHGAPSTAQPYLLLLLLTVGLRWTFYDQPPQLSLRTLLAVGLYLGATLASQLYAIDVSSSREAWVDLLKDMIVALAITMLLKTARNLRQVIWTLLAAGFVLGSISVYQYLTGTLGNNYGGFGQAAVQNIVGETNDYRVAGPIGDPNFYAQMLVVLAPLALERLWHERRPQLRLLAGATLVVSVLAILFTFSRGGFLALLVVLLLILVRRPPRLASLLLTVILVVPLLQFVPDTYMERIRTIPDAIPLLTSAPQSEISLRGRTSELTSAWLMFSDNPLLGVGLNNYPLHYQRYSELLGLDPRREERTPHNLFLQIAAETGLAGLSMFCLLIWLMFRGMRQAMAQLKQASLSNEAALVRAFSIGVVGYLVAAFFLHAAYPRYFWLLAGIALAIPHVARHELAARGIRSNAIARA